MSDIIEVPGITVDLDSTTSSIAIGDPITGDKANVALNNDAATYSLKTRDDDAIAELELIKNSAAVIEGNIPAGLTVVGDELKVVASGAIAVSSLPVSFGAGNSDVTTQRVVVATDQANLPILVKSSLITVPHDQIALTYVGATTDIATVVAKLSGSTVATLTLTYDGSNRLVDILRT